MSELSYFVGKDVISERGTEENFKGHGETAAKCIILFYYPSDIPTKLTLVSVLILQCSSVVHDGRFCLPMALFVAPYLTETAMHFMVSCEKIS